MFVLSTCARGSRPLVRFIDGSGQALWRSTRDVPVNGTLIRSFRLQPTRPASMRSRFGKSQGSSKGGSSASQPIVLDTSRIAIAAGAAIGLGGLCYYGLSQSTARTDSMSAFDRAAVWPDYVRQRIKVTYAYLAGGAAIAAGTAAALSRSPAFCRVMLRPGWLAPIGMLVASMGAGIVCQSIPYPTSGGIGTKHLAWAVFASSIGGMLMPVCLIGGPILTRAALYTGGIVGGLSLVAASAPSDRFLTWGGPLAIGLGVVVVSSLGSMFLSPVGRLGSGMAAISLYGGLLLFSGFLLYDTQLVIKRAEEHPAIEQYGGQMFGGMRMNQNQFTMRPFDPINNSIHILMDTVNIFVRIVAILAGGQRRK